MRKMKICNDRIEKLLRFFFCDLSKDIIIMWCQLNSVWWNNNGDDIKDNKAPSYGCNANATTYVTCV